MSQTHNVCFGDVVVLESLEYECRYVGSEAFTSKECRLADSEDKGFVMFKVLPRHSYRHRREAQKAFKSTGELPDDIQRLAHQEEETNDVSVTEHIGKPVLYGQGIQLQSMRSRMFLSSNKRLHSVLESDSLVADLQPGSDRSWMQFKQLHNGKVEGDSVSHLDSVSIVSIIDGYSLRAVHQDPSMNKELVFDSCEHESMGFRVYSVIPHSVFHSSTTKKRALIHGSFLRLELMAESSLLGVMPPIGTKVVQHLVARQKAVEHMEATHDDFRDTVDQVLGDLSVVLRGGRLADGDDSASSIFELQIVDPPQGGVMQFTATLGCCIRLRHLVTEKFLCVNAGENHQCLSVSSEAGTSCNFQFNAPSLPVGSPVHDQDVVNILHKVDPNGPSIEGLTHRSRSPAMLSKRSQSFTQGSKGSPTSAGNICVLTSDPDFGGDSDGGLAAHLRKRAKGVRACVIAALRNPESTDSVKVGACNQVEADALKWTISCRKRLLQLLSLQDREGGWLGASSLSILNSLLDFGTCGEVIEDGHVHPVGWRGAVIRDSSRTKMLRAGYLAFQSDLPGCIPSITDSMPRMQMQSKRRHKLMRQSGILDTLMVVIRQGASIFSLIHGDAQSTPPVPFVTAVRTVEVCVEVYPKNGRYLSTNLPFLLKSLRHGAPVSGLLMCLMRSRDEEITNSDASLARLWHTASMFASSPRSKSLRFVRATLKSGNDRKESFEDLGYEEQCLPFFDPRKPSDMAIIVHPWLSEAENKGMEELSTLGGIVQRIVSMLDDCCSTKNGKLSSELLGLLAALCTTAPGEEEKAADAQKVVLDQVLLQPISSSRHKYLTLARLDRASAAPEIVPSEVALPDFSGVSIPMEKDSLEEYDSSIQDHVIASAILISACCLGVHEEPMRCSDIVCNQLHLISWETVLTICVQSHENGNCCPSRIRSAYLELLNTLFLCIPSRQPIARKFSAASALDLQSMRTVFPTAASGDDSRFTWAPTLDSLQSLLHGTLTCISEQVDDITKDTTPDQELMLRYVEILGSLLSRGLVVTTASLERIASILFKLLSRASVNGSSVSQPAASHDILFSVEMASSDIYGPNAVSTPTCNYYKLIDALHLVCMNCLAMLMDIRKYGRVHSILAMCISTADRKQARVIQALQKKRQSIDETSTIVDKSNFLKSLYRILGALSFGFRWDDALSMSDLPDDLMCEVFEGLPDWVTNLYNRGFPGSDANSTESRDFEFESEYGELSPPVEELRVGSFERCIVPLLYSCNDDVASGALRLLCRHFGQADEVKSDLHESVILRTTEAKSVFTKGTELMNKIRQCFSEPMAGNANSETGILNQLKELILELQTLASVAKQVAESTVTKDRFAAQCLLRDIGVHKQVLAVLEGSMLAKRISLVPSFRKHISVLGAGVQVSSVSRGVVNSSQVKSGAAPTQFDMEKYILDSTSPDFKPIQFSSSRLKNHAAELRRADEGSLEKALRSPVRQLREACHGFLMAFCAGNVLTQADVFPHFDMLARASDGVSALRSLRAIIADNSSLCERLSRNQIRQIAIFLDSPDATAGAEALRLLQSVIFPVSPGSLNAGKVGEILHTNANRVLEILLERPRGTLALLAQPDHHKKWWHLVASEWQHRLGKGESTGWKEDVHSPLLEYHVEVVKTLTACTLTADIQMQMQAIIPISSLKQIICNGCLPPRIRGIYLLALSQIYLRSFPTTSIKDVLTSRDVLEVFEHLRKHISTLADGSKTPSMRNPHTLPTISAFATSAMQGRAAVKRSQASLSTTAKSILSAQVEALSGSEFGFIFDYILPFWLNLSAQNLHSGAIRGLAAPMVNGLQSIADMTKQQLLSSKQTQILSSTLFTILNDSPVGDSLPRKEGTQLHTIWESVDGLLSAADTPSDTLFGSEANVNWQCQLLSRTRESTMQGSNRWDKLRNLVSHEDNTVSMSHNDIAFARDKYISVIELLQKADGSAKMFLFLERAFRSDGKSDNVEIASSATVGENNALIGDGGEEWISQLTISSVNTSATNDTATSSKRPSKSMLSDKNGFGSKIVPLSVLRPSRLIKHSMASVHEISFNFVGLIQQLVNVGQLLDCEEDHRTLSIICAGCRLSLAAARYGSVMENIDKTFGFPVTEFAAGECIEPAAGVWDEQHLTHCNEIQRAIDTSIDSKVDRNDFRVISSTLISREFCKSLSEVKANSRKSCFVTNGIPSLCVMAGKSTDEDLLFNSLTLSESLLRDGFKPAQEKFFEALTQDQASSILFFQRLQDRFQQDATRLKASSSLKDKSGNELPKSEANRVKHLAWVVLKSTEYSITGKLLHVLPSAGNWPTAASVAVSDNQEWANFVKDPLFGLFAEKDIDDAVIVDEVLEVLRWFCEGQFKPMQDLLRSQSNVTMGSSYSHGMAALSTVNFLSETILLLSKLEAVISTNTCSVICKALGVLTDVAMDNEENTAYLLRSGDYLRFLSSAMKFGFAPLDKLLSKGLDISRLASEANDLLVAEQQIIQDTSADSGESHIANHVARVSRQLTAKSNPQLARKVYFDDQVKQLMHRRKQQLALVSHIMDAMQPLLSYGNDHVVAMQIGQIVTVDPFLAALRKLGDSGYFDELNHLHTILLQNKGDIPEETLQFLLKRWVRRAFPEIWKRFGGVMGPFKKTPAPIKYFCHLLGGQLLLPVLMIERDLGFDLFRFLLLFKDVVKSANDFPDMFSTLEGQIERIPAFDFFADSVGTIEIMRNSKSVRLYFPIDLRARDELTDEVKQRVLWNVDRESSTKKLESFVDLIEAVMSELDHRVELSRNFWTNITSDNVILWKNIVLFLSLLINVTITISYRGNPDGNGTNSGPGEFDWKDSNNFIFDRTGRILVLIFGILHLAFTILLVCSHVLTEGPVKVRRNLETRLSTVQEMARVDVKLPADSQVLDVFPCTLDKRSYGDADRQNSATMGSLVVASNHLCFVGAGNDTIIDLKSICYVAIKGADIQVVKDESINRFTSKVLDLHQCMDITKTRLAVGDGRREPELDLRFGKVGWRHDAYVAIISALQASKRNMPLQQLEMSSFRKASLRAYYFSKTPMLLYYMVYTALSILGLLVHPCFFAAHLLDIVNRSKLLKSVLQAVSKNAKSIALTLCLLAVMLYIFAIAGFFLFRDRYILGSDPVLFYQQSEQNPSQFIPNGVGQEFHSCDSLFWCFMTHLSISVRNGGTSVAEEDPCFMEECEETKDSGLATASRYIYDLMFFVIIITVLLNIVFGIIIDGFGVLRDENSEVENDIRKRCFICQLESYDFDKKADGFEKHIKGGVDGDHNMWNYMFFFRYIRSKDPTDLTALEMYVKKCLTDRDYKFFPLHYASCLGEDEEENEDASNASILLKMSQMKQEFEEQLATLQDLIQDK